jgi:hypothetical protein
MAKRKKIDPALSAERAYQAEKSHANRSSWQEHAVFLGVQRLAVIYLENPAAFKNGVCSYAAYKDKANFHFDLAKAVREMLTAEGNTMPDPKTGGLRQIFNIEKVTDQAVEQMLKPSRTNSKRELFDATLAERLAHLKAPPMFDEPMQDDLSETVETFDKLLDP